MTRALATLLVVVAAVGIATGSRGGKTSQPLRFSHRLHVEDHGMDCTDCHRHVLERARATIPNIEVCGECHEGDPMTESPDEARLLEHVGERVPIPWKRVFWLPEDVHFSHRLHTSVAGIECERCHGDVRGETATLTRPLIRLDMADCIKCHETSGVTSDCIRCHR